MPPWRTFSSSASAQPTAGAELSAAPAPPRPTPGWLVPVLAALGGAAAGAALVMLVTSTLGLLPGSGATVVHGEPLEAGFARATGSDASALETTDIVVDVAGAVARPGLHRLGPGDRVGDAIEAAGGFAPRADLAAASQTLNLAQTLEDGAKVLVPELGNDGVAAAGISDGRVDLNRAGQSELESLPGVGPVTASKIIDARAERPFSTERDLRTRGLVGESVFDDLKDLVRAG